jgi:uncharacterized membrane protein
MLISKYFVAFIFYSFLGWVWESIYCTVKQKEWQDRGFLFGPVCPIYGSSVVALIFLFRLLQKAGVRPDTVPVWILFLICMFGSAVMEFSTSWVLEKRFRARWWDYSGMPLNLQGRICVPVSIGFGVAGVLIFRFLVPAVTRLHVIFPDAFYEGLALLLAGLAGADLALTEASLSSLLGNIEAFKSEFNEKAEKTYTAVADMPETLKNAEQRLRVAAAGYVGKLSFIEKHILRNIVTFTRNPQEAGVFAGRDSHPGKRLKDALLNRKKNAEED